MRSELAGRPLLLASLGLVAGISTVEHPLNVLFLILILAVCLRRVSACLWASGAFLLGLMVAPAPIEYSPITPGLWEGTGTVVSAPTLGGRSQTCTFESESRRYQLVALGRSTLALGQTLRLKAAIKPLGIRGASWAEQGIEATLICPVGQLRIMRPGPPWFESMVRVRNSFFGMVDAALLPPQASVVNALCFGTSGPVQEGTRQALARIGAVHILTASGLQVILLALLLHTLFSFVPLRRGWQIGLIVFALAAYATGTGLHPVIIRAAVVASLAMGAYLFRREADFLSALGFAAILTVLWAPWTIYSAGFQLSYITVGALALFWRPFESASESRLLNRLLARGWILLRVSLIATLAAGPLTAYHFGVVSLISPLSNLLVGVVVPVIILVALVAWPLRFVASAVSLGLLKMVAGPLATWILLVSGVLGRQYWSSISVPPFDPYWLAPYYAGFVLLWARRWRQTL